MSRTSRSLDWSARMRSSVVYSLWSFARFCGVDELCGRYNRALSRTLTLTEQLATHLARARVLERRLHQQRLQPHDVLPFRLELHTHMRIRVQ